MRVYIMEQGSKVWDLVVNGYSTKTNPPTNVDRRRLTNNNVKTMNAILFGLVYFEFMKVMQCELAKDMWGKLQTIYKGDEKVKEAKLQTYRA